MTDDTPPETGTNTDGSDGDTEVEPTFGVDAAVDVDTDAAVDSDADAAARRRTDGGTAAGADAVALDPWGSSTIADYRKLFAEFGIEEFDAVLEEVPDPHYLMRRGVIFGHRDYRPVAEALRNDDPVAVLSGFMPTGDPHIGHKLVFDEIVWHQEQGADAYGLIADLEAHAARGLTWTEIDEHARDYLLSLLALGFDPDEGTLYRQSDNREVQDLAFELGSKARFAELEGIYGFDSETSVSHMQSVVTQMADILYPQVDEPKPTVIPVGPDQDPHVRLARDLAARMRFFKVTEAYFSQELDDAERVLVAEAYESLAGRVADDRAVRCVHGAQYLLGGAEAVDLDADRPSVDPPEGADPVTASAAEKLRNAGMEPLRPRVRFLDRDAPEHALEDLVERIPGEKRRYDAHVDAFDLSVEEAETLARRVEVDNGGYGFYPPSSIYHRFMTGLTGGKMSSSIPASHISLLDDPDEGYAKVKSATTGGRDTAEEQREKGGEADKCPVYELYAYLLSGDDDEFAKRVYDECVGGERLCGDCKEQAATLMEEFLADHQEKRREAESLLDDLDLDLELDSSRRRVAGETDD
jgi:tryptophanyl-tRNA synthetase